MDTCAGEFEAYTPYFYSTYQGLQGASETRAAQSSSAKKIMILGGGPNRIGQGVEFDYCCVQAAMALREAGWQTIMVNSNPETVSTDFDMADRLYFEPLTVEDVMNVLHLEKPKGVIVTLGGQTAINLAQPLHELGVPIIGTDVEAICNAEDRGRFERIMHELNIPQPEAEAYLQPH